MFDPEVNIKVGPCPYCYGDIYTSNHVKNNTYICTSCTKLVSTDEIKTVLEMSNEEQDQLLLLATTQEELLTEEVNACTDCEVENCSRTYEGAEPSECQYKITEQEVKSESIVEEECTPFTEDQIQFIKQLIYTETEQYRKDLSKLTENSGKLTRLGKNAITKEVKELVDFILENFRIINNKSFGIQKDLFYEMMSEIEVQNYLNFDINYDLIDKAMKYIRNNYEEVKIVAGAFRFINDEFSTTVFSASRYTIWGLELKSNSWLSQALSIQWYRDDDVWFDYKLNEDKEPIYQKGKMYKNHKVENKLDSPVSKSLLEYDNYAGMVFRFIKNEQDILKIRNKMTEIISDNPLLGDKMLEKIEQIRATKCLDAYERPKYVIESLDELRLFHLIFGKYVVRKVSSFYYPMKQRHPIVMGLVYRNEDFVFNYSKLRQQLKEGKISSEIPCISRFISEPNQHFGLSSR